MKTAKDIVESDLKFISEELADELPQLAGTNLLIIGGAGFLGYYLVQGILYWNSVHADGEKIQLYVLDNFIRGVPEWLSSLEGQDSLVLRKHDVIDPLPDDLPPFQYIIHAASIASPMFYRKYPIETMDANVNGLRNLLEYCLDRKKTSDPVRGFLFYSTSEIYGDPGPDDIPTAETYRGNVSCTGPRACYDESKRYGETLCVNFAAQYDLPIKVARPFNNYGPGLKITDKRVLPDFAMNILSGQDIVMLSDGSPTRTFCYIADAIVGYYKILVRGRPGEAYNIGKETPEISMRELAERAVAMGKKLFGYEGEIVFKVSQDQHYLTDNPNRRCPIIEKARSELDYEPKIEIDDGLERSLLWYRDNQTAEDA